MTEAALLAEVTALRDKVAELELRLEACHRISAMNLVTLTEERWRPAPWVGFHKGAEESST